MPQTNQQDKMFGGWLLAQRDREGLVGQLGARADRVFLATVRPRMSTGNSPQYKPMAICSNPRPIG